MKLKMWYNKQEDVNATRLTAERLQIINIKHLKYASQYASIKFLLLQLQVVHSQRHLLTNFTSSNTTIPYLYQAFLGHLKIQLFQDVTLFLFGLLDPHKEGTTYSETPGTPHPVTYYHIPETLGFMNTTVTTSNCTL